MLKIMLKMWWYTLIYNANIHTYACLFELSNKEDTPGKLCSLTKLTFSSGEDGIFKIFWHVTLSFRAAFCMDWHGVLFSFQDPCMESSAGLNSATCFHVTASRSCLRSRAMCNSHIWETEAARLAKHTKIPAVCGITLLRMFSCCTDRQWHSGLNLFIVCASFDEKHERRRAIQLLCVRVYIKNISW